MAVSWSLSGWTDYVQIWFVDAWIHGLVPFEGFMAVAPKLAPKSPEIVSPKLSPWCLRTYLAQIWCRVVKRYDIMAFIGFCVRVAIISAKVVAKMSPKLHINGGRLEPKRMGGFCSNLVCRYMTIWSSAFWGFHGGRAKIVAKMSPKLHFNGGQLESKCVDGLYSNLVCRCMNPWASAFWGFHGGRAKIGAKVARNIIAKIVAKISTNVFSSDMM